MLMLYNPPRKPKAGIEIETRTRGSTGTAAVYHFTDYVELLYITLQRSSLGRNGPASLQCTVTVSFLKQGQVVKTRTFSFRFAADVDNHYPLMLLKPKDVDEIQMSSTLILSTRVESRLIFKQEVPDAVGLPDLIYG